MGVHRHSMLRRAGALLLAGGLVAALAASPAAVLAGTAIDVNSELNTVANDGECTLREAIAAANDDTASGAMAGECLAGNGTDTITFTGSGAISVPLGQELPDITEAVTIDGRGQMVINGAFEITTGICLCASGSTLKNVLIEDVNGNAVHVEGSVTLSGVRLWGNERAIDVAAGSTLTVADSDINGNTTTTGSGVYANEGSTVTIVRTTISNNQADAEGAGIRMVGSTVTLDRSTLYNNEATDGGGIYMESPAATSTLKVYNSTIADNTASGQGGGIFRQGNIDIRNSTIAHNTATTSGGGVKTDGGPWTFVMNNTAILGNTTGLTASDWSATGELGGAVNSIVGLAGKTLGDYFSPSTLADNGGPTKTLKPKVIAGNTLVDGGNGTVCASAPISGKDQRGYGRVNPCDIGAVDVDRTKPVVSGVKVSLRQWQTLSGSKSRGRLTWSASDSGSGLKQYTVQRRVDGGSWSTIASGLTSKSFDVTLARTHDYRFRVRAYDKEGNRGTFAYSATFEARLYQQTSSAFTYSGSWATSTADVFSGGSTRRSSTYGSSVRFTATGRSFAWITTTGPTRGIARIYVNGTFVAAIDLNYAGTTHRLQAWTRTYSSSVTKTIRIVVSKAGERVDMDAFAVLR